MSWQNTLTELIETKFRNEWTFTEDDHIDYGSNDNSFKQPEDFTPWVRIYLTVLTNGNAEVGTKFQRARCILTVACFVKDGIGEKLSNTMCGEVSTIFQNQNFNGVQIFAMTPVKITPANGWFQQNAKFDFLYDVFS